MTHLKRPWCWERSKMGEEGDNRGWDSRVASQAQWTWVWVNCGSWWRTGKPGMLQSTGSQRIGHDWVTELQWKKQAENVLSTPPLMYNKRKAEIIQYFDSSIHTLSLLEDIHKNYLMLVVSEERTLNGWVGRSFSATSFEPFEFWTTTWMYNLVFKINKIKGTAAMGHY